MADRSGEYLYEQANDALNAGRTTYLRLRSIPEWLQVKELVPPGAGGVLRLVTLEDGSKLSFPHADLCAVRSEDGSVDGAIG